VSTIQAHGKLLTASVEDRVLSYLLLPYGEPGRTNVGKVTASKGVLKLPEDASTLLANMEHDRKRPIGRFVSIEEQDQGLVASLRVANTSVGNDLLAEAAEGLRTGISVEIDNPVIRQGQLLGGSLSGAGVVTDPAFPSAQLVAADAGDLPEGIEYTAPVESSDTREELVVIDGVTYKRVTTSTHKTETTVVEGEPTGSQDAEQSAGSENDVSTQLAAAAAAPQGLHAANVNKEDKSANEVFKLLASEYRAGGERRMLAALSDIVPGDILGLEQPQIVGELWSGRAFVRKVIPLFNHADLTSFKVQGWRWVTKPVVAAYAGNKAAVPSNSVETAPVSIDAERIAGAHDIDRKFKDFGDAAFFEAYYKAMTESYAQVSDAAVLADVITAAGAPVVGGSVPTGVAPGMAKIVDGALAVLNDANALPTFAVVATDLYRALLLTRQDDTLTYLNAALGLEDGTVGSFRVVPSGAITAGQVLVGAREAVTVHELGQTPIRVEAENIANGGVDAGVFGYYAVNVHDADALVLVS